MNKKEKTQADVIILSNRFSLWRDYYQWFLYDFHDSRERENGTLKKLPSPTYHPKLEQLVSFMTELTAREATELVHIETLVNTHKFQIYDFLKKQLAPLGLTPSDAASKLGGKHEH